MIKNVLTPNAPIPAGHYSQAVIHDNTIYISGQLPIIPESGEKIIGTVEEQTLQVLKNIKAITEAAGSDLSKIVKVTIYVSDIDNWGTINQVYSDFFRAFKPARTVVPVKSLHYGFEIEMDAIAVI
jgi:2-iminobutanoate/2-iminopropanoate deaminase